MGIVIILIVIVVFVGFIFISIKFNNLKYRVKQQILRNTGISSSEINAGFTEGLEKKHLEKFLADNPMYTEESIKDLFKSYAESIIKKEARKEFSETVKEKIYKDGKLDKLQSMEYKRANINFYANAKLACIVIYTDNRDEYNIYMNCNIVDGKVVLEKYNISKGMVVGF